QRAPKGRQEAERGGPKAGPQVARVELLDQERLGAVSLPAGYQAAISGQRQPLRPISSALFTDQVPRQPEQMASPMEVVRPLARGPRGPDGVPIRPEGRDRYPAIGSHGQATEPSRPEARLQLGVLAKVAAGLVGRRSGPGGQVAQAEAK